MLFHNISRSSFLQSDHAEANRIFATATLFRGICFHPHHLSAQLHSPSITKYVFHFSSAVRNNRSIHVIVDRGLFTSTAPRRHRHTTIVINSFRKGDLPLALPSTSPQPPSKFHFRHKQMHMETRAREKKMIV